MNFYEGCDLTEKLYLTFTVTYLYDIIIIIHMQKGQLVILFLR